MFPAVRHILAVAAAALTLASCGTTSALYYWGPSGGGATGYENAAYRNYKERTPESVCNLIYVYEQIVSRPDGTRKMPPPGICAEYGYLLLQPDVADIFYHNASDRQRRLFGNLTDYAGLFRERTADRCVEQVLGVHSGGIVDRRHHEEHKRLLLIHRRIQAFARPGHLVRDAA